MSQNVLLLFNAPTLPVDHPDTESERAIVDTVRVVASELREAGLRVSQLAVSNDPMPLVEKLEGKRPDVVFNLFEGLAEQPETEAFVAGLLEWYRVPYTGCPFASMVLSRDKPRAKLLLRGAGLPTAAYLLVDQLPVPEHSLSWPLLVKPANQDASVGLDQNSVVQDAATLERQIGRVLDRFGGPVLVEEFLSGREFNVAVIENPGRRLLPIGEIVFDRSDPDFWPLVTYEAKWATHSRDDLATVPVCPADLDARLDRKLGALALRAFAVTGCRDYARIDFRTNSAGTPYILEVNPNPDYDPTAGLTRQLKAAGISHAEFTVHLVRQAFRRNS